jgi:hypothetical protein
MIEGSFQMVQPKRGESAGKDLIEGASKWTRIREGLIEGASEWLGRRGEKGLADA